MSTKYSPTLTSENQLKKIVREEIRNELATTKVDLIDTFTKVATEFKSEILNSVDKVLGELQDLRIEKTAQSGKLSDHEDRIGKLEDLHPELQSASI